MPYRQLENGKRQITSIFVPGDFCKPLGALPRLVDYTLNTLTPVLLGRVSPQPYELRSTPAISSIFQ